MDNTDQKCLSCLLLAIECWLETSTAETYPGAKLGGQLELTHLCLQKPSRHINVFYRCPVVIYSAQKNTLNSTKRGAGFSAQPGSCFSPPPAARAGTGEHFTAELPNPLLLAWRGARPIVLWSQALASTKGWCCLQSWGASPAARASALVFCFWSKWSLDQHALGREKGKTSARTPPGARHTEMPCPTCLSHSAALDDRRAWALLSFQHRHLHPVRIWHWVWKGKLLLLSWKSMTAVSIPDKLEKGCQETPNTLKAKFLQVSTQLQSTVSCHTMYGVEEHMHQCERVKQSSIK